MSRGSTAKKNCAFPAATFAATSLPKMAAVRRAGSSEARRMAQGWGEWAGLPNAKLADEL